MQQFLKSFNQQVQSQPNSTAISNTEVSISYSTLNREIEQIGKQCREHNINRLAIAMTNSPAYVVIDTTCVFEHIVSIPIPHFFSPSQIKHLIKDANIDSVIIDNSFDYKSFFSKDQIELIADIQIFDLTYKLIRLQPQDNNKQLPVDTLKISYTSGTTGHPKGVLISSAQVDNVVSSLTQALAANTNDRHISVLPFSLLLENIAGIYTVLAAGGHCIVPDLSELGLEGSSSLDIQKFVQSLIYYKPTTMITVPQLAQALVMATEQLGLVHNSLRFIAVGGAPLSSSIHNKAHDLGLPLYEGYGLTECSSVVALNTANDFRIGSVGKPLTHIDIQISTDSEVLVRGALCNGYLNDSNCNQKEYWATGDTGYLDEDGFLYITGRKRTTYCTAFGRNVSPEWVESELTSQPQIRQAMIFGEGKPFNLAIIVANESVNDTDLQIAIETTNKRLPDYARISNWIKAANPYSVMNNQLSPGGIIQRNQISDDYKNEIDAIYQ